jgi:hypothetical protein
MDPTKLIERTWENSSSKSFYRESSLEKYQQKMQYPYSALDMQKSIHGFAKNWALDKKEATKFHNAICAT